MSPQKTRPSVYNAGYCTDSERAEKVRDALENQGVDPSKWSIRDNIPDERIYTKFSTVNAELRHYRVIVSPGSGCDDPFTSDEMSAFNRWAWDLVKMHGFNNRWSSTNQESLIIDWDYIDRVL